MFWSQDARTWKARLVSGLAASTIVMSLSVVNPISTAAATAGYSSAVLTDAPSAYWRLGDTVGSTAVADSSVQNHPADVRGAVTLGVAGSLVGDTNTAASLTGTTGYLRGRSSVSVGSNF